MSANRLDAMVCREKGDKKYWTKVGVAFPTQGGGWSIQLDALPVDGKIVLLPPRERRERGDAYEGSDDEPWGGR